MGGRECRRHNFKLSQAWQWRRLGEAFLPSFAANRSDALALAGTHLVILDLTSLGSRPSHWPFVLDFRLSWHLKIIQQSLLSWYVLDCINQYFLILSALQIGVLLFYLVAALSVCKLLINIFISSFSRQNYGFFWGMADGPGVRSVYSSHIKFKL